ncbi:MAG TPA: VTT domain-containing protein [Gammaproteobacteria bacterium]|nr:VTT domain-containing protein [Gammaproteobacteria bacterium]
MSALAKRILLSFVIVCILLICYLSISQYLNFDFLLQNSQLLETWKQQHYWLTLIGFISLNIIAVSFALPSNVLFAVTAGFLFGTLPGTLYVVLSIVLGSLLLFSFTKKLFLQRLDFKGQKWLKLQIMLKENTFLYLLICRMIPIFPSWAITIISSILNISLTKFIGATLLGIIPTIIVLTTLGSSLKLSLKNISLGSAVFLNPINSMIMLVPLIIALLAIMSFKYFKKRLA